MATPSSEQRRAVFIRNHMFWNVERKIRPVEVCVSIRFDSIIVPLINELIVRDRFSNEGAMIEDLIVKALGSGTNDDRIVYTCQRCGYSIRLAPRESAQADQTTCSHSADGGHFFARG